MGAVVRFLAVLALLLVGLGKMRLAAQATRAEADSVTAGPQTQALDDSLAKPKVRFNRFNRPPLYSAIIPGAGQFVNHQYYKIPIIYAGGATLAYFWVTNNRYYQSFKRALTYRLDNDSNTTDSQYGLYTDAQVLRARDYYRRNRDLTVILSAVLYGLQIADAHVFAHLREFNVNDNLTLRADPVFIPRYMAGASLTLNFRR